MGYQFGKDNAEPVDPASPVGPAEATPGWAEHAEPFYGTHQSGIATDPQAHAIFVAFDLPTGSAADTARDDLRRLLRMWSSDAERLQRGAPTISDAQPHLAGPPSRLTITAGLGRGALEKAGLADRAPEWLAPLPPFSIDKLEPRWSDGDIVAQVCAEDPIVLAHAMRALIIDATGIASLRWQQRGFRRPVTSPSTMRNLMGQVDGTVQPPESDYDDLVWVGSDGPAWLQGGSSLVLRRIRMNLDTWDELDPPAKEQVIGRRLGDGSPLTGMAETDPADFEALTRGGLPVIPEFAHMRQAAPVEDHEKILRRPYNYDEVPSDGQTADAGLLFAAYQRDPVAQFVPIQQRLATSDLLNVWTTPVGSAVFAILPGVEEGGYLGESLLS